MVISHIDRVVTKQLFNDIIIMRISSTALKYKLNQSYEFDSCIN